MPGELRRHQPGGAARRRSRRSGESLTRGLANLLGDVQKGRISQTDEARVRGRPQPRGDAGRRGVRERADPADPVPRRRTAQVRDAAAGDGAAVHQQVLHPRPAAGELVRRATRWRAGHTVFMVSWRNVEAEQGHFTLGRLPREGRVQRAARGAGDREERPGQRARLLRRRHAARRGARGARRKRSEQLVASATFLATMLDFSEPGQIGLFVDEASVAAREATIGARRHPARARPRVRVLQPARRTTWSGPTW